MIYALLPYYYEDRPEFEESLKLQTVPYRLIRRNRQRDGIYWTKAMNDFRKELIRYRGVKRDDVVCILNNDIVFLGNYFEEGSKIKQGEIGIPQVYDGHRLSEWGLMVDWSRKAFSYFKDCRIDCFGARGIFITAGDFIDSGGYSRLLPHYLADYAFAIKMIKKGLKPVRLNCFIEHKEHRRDIRVFSALNPKQPIYWTIFLFLCGRNKYLPLNILKSWVSALT